MNEVNFIGSEKPQLPEPFCTCDAIKRCETATEASDMCRKCKLETESNNNKFYNTESYMGRTNKQYREYAKIICELIRKRGVR